MRKTTLLALAALTPTTHAQFGPQAVVAAQANAEDIFAIDIDGDGDQDLISASLNNETVSWHENLGGGAFAPPQVIATQVENVVNVFAIDVDGDADADVLSSPLRDGQLLWYENLGGGAFGPKQVIATSLAIGYLVKGLHAGDLDGDGDADVLARTDMNDQLAWYENLGGGSFALPRVIDAALQGLKDIRMADFDGDGDEDILATASTYNSSVIAWYENLGGGAFGPRRALAMPGSTMYRYERAVTAAAADVDSDGDLDIVGAFNESGHIIWWENLGAGAFASVGGVIQGPAQGNSGMYPEDLAAADIDGDGDSDLVATDLNASYYSGGFGAAVWYENLGAGTFTMHLTPARNSSVVVAADLDNDGATDIAYGGIDVAWCAQREVTPFRVDGPASTQGWSGYAGDWFTYGFSWQADGTPGRYTQLEGSLGLSWTTGPAGITELQFAPGDALHLSSELSAPEMSLTDVELEIVSSSLVVAPSGDFTGEVHVMFKSGTLYHPHAGEPYPLSWDLTGYRCSSVASGRLDQLACDLTVELDLSCGVEVSGRPGGCADSYCYDVYVGFALSGPLKANSTCPCPRTYCTASANSTGQAGTIDWSGSTRIQDNNFALSVSQLPPHQVACMLMSRETGLQTAFGGGGGTSCLGLPVFRFTRQGLSTGASGSVDLQLDLQALPGGVTFEPGERWNFQLWHRDSNPLATTNLTMPLAVTWCP